MESLVFIKSFLSFEDANDYLADLMAKYSADEVTNVIGEASVSKIGGLFQVRFSVSDGQYELFNSTAYGENNQLGLARGANTATAFNLRGF